MRRKFIYGLVLGAALLQGCANKDGAPAAKYGAPAAGAPESARQANGEISLNPYLEEAAIQSSSAQEYAEAAAYWGALFDASPDNANAAFQCAVNLRYSGDGGGAVNVLNMALKRHPDDLRLRAERGRAYAFLGSFDLALEDIEAASAANTADWPVHSTHGVVLDRLERHAEAETAYNKALALAPGNPKVLNNLALSYALAGRHDDAEATLRRAVQHPDASPQIRQNLSLLLAMHGDVKEAAKLARADLPNAMAENNTAYYEGLIQ